MTKFSTNLKKLIFGAKKIAFVIIQRTLMIPFQENVWTDRQKNVQALFHKIHPTTAKDPKYKNTKDMC